MKHRTLARRKEWFELERETIKKNGRTNQVATIDGVGDIDDFEGYVLQLDDPDGEPGDYLEVEPNEFGHYVVKGEIVAYWAKFEEEETKNVFYEDYSFGNGWHPNYEDVEFDTEREGFDEAWDEYIEAWDDAIWKSVKTQCEAKGFDVFRGGNEELNLYTRGQHIRFDEEAQAEMDEWYREASEGGVVVEFPESLKKFIKH